MLTPMLYYFGYGSNMNAVSLAAKGVTPASSVPASVRNFRLAFNVKHWFPHEGGVGNIVVEPGGLVQGVLHQINPQDLAALDKVESYGEGYDRIEVDVVTQTGQHRALTYVGIERWLDDSCRPTARYLNILIAGAKEMGLSAAYIKGLEQQERFIPPVYGAYLPLAGAETSTFNVASLRTKPSLTGLYGHVFDMREAAEHLQHLRQLFGGRDTTLFFMKRHDTATGTETWDDVRDDNISAPLRNYLNAYLHNFDGMFRYVGNLRYR